METTVASYPVEVQPLTGKTDYKRMMTMMMILYIKNFIYLKTMDIAHCTRKKNIKFCRPTEPKHFWDVTGNKPLFCFI